MNVAIKSYKNAILVTLGLLASNAIIAQPKAALNVVYEFTYVRDLENRADPYRENTILTLADGQSRFCSERLYNENSPQEREVQQQAAMDPKGPVIVVVGRPMLRVGKYGSIVLEEIHKDITNDKLTTVGIFGFQTYYMDGAMPDIAWEMGSERKQIGAYECRKATGAYAGRNYTVWFAPDLPFSDGPWKLGGLPGLILEAHDDKNEVAFVVKEISKNTDARRTVMSFLRDENSIETNPRAYRRARMAFEQDPETVAAAQRPNSTLVISNVDDPEDNTVKKIKKYNPMELD